MKEIEVSRLITILEQIDYPVLFEVDLESVWYTDGDSVYWNTDKNIDDLLNHDGNTYSGYLPEGEARQGKYFICNVDTQCGQWVTSILSLDKEVGYE